MASSTGRFQMYFFVPCLLRDSENEELLFLTVLKHCRRHLALHDFIFCLNKPYLILSKASLLVLAKSICYRRDGITPFRLAISLLSLTEYSLITIPFQYFYNILKETKHKGDSIYLERGRATYTESSSRYEILWFLVERCDNERPCHGRFFDFCLGILLKGGYREDYYRRKYNTKAGKCSTFGKINQRIPKFWFVQRPSCFRQLTRSQNKSGNNHFSS